MTVRFRLGHMALAIALIAGLAAAVAPADKVTICHRQGNGGSHTITVSPNAVPAHQQHGDTLGALPGKRESISFRSNGKEPL